ncbi:PREDICTED: nucleoporin-62 C-terminal-like protein isoform X2 [Galeopterus variegatus]|nr:PREDICTED: nucleoporin-62 C-terminal-like protein isoform X2 [Galeopterus variegatus]XP_008582210.1 PREDICTED: nucleoporin-62 C-terminal-like protein isoform X2 [Galeopterus variegatus]
MFFTSLSTAFTSTAATRMSSTISTSNTSTITTTTTTTVTSGLTQNLKLGRSTGTNTTVAVGVTSVPFTSTVNAIVTPVMAYGQLENLTNNWSFELEDYEKYFLYHATHVDAWKRALIDNDEKITTLYGELEKVKLDQKRLEEELDFILSEQKELENILIPLEEFLKDQSRRRPFYLQYPDEERERIYKLAEIIEAQLKQMSQDLKDIIGHLNSLESRAESTDPLQKICKILNAHMNSLQWIEHNSDMLQRKVEEITALQAAAYNVKIAFD